MTIQKSVGNKNSNRFFVLSASSRSESLNTRLAKLAGNILEKKGCEVDFADLNEYICPSYNQDVEKNKGLPEGAQKFHEKLLTTDAFIIASPEYNASMPGSLKNVIDWVSRYRPQPFNERHSLLMSASPSMSGGNRGLWSLRIPLEHLGSRVFPDMFSLASAHHAFTQDGNLIDTTLTERFENNLFAFMNLVEAAKHYPCMKKAWVEFLGEKPDPAIERVE